MPKFDNIQTVIAWTIRGIPLAALAGYLLARLFIQLGWTR
jgi:flavin-dependent dehydrogenase